MRIALIGTPRSGNNWVRSILCESLGLEPIGVFNWTEAPDPLPDRCVLNIHWYREPNFQRYLEREGFRLVVLARHPLDVLISVLAFVRHEPLARCWLDGNVEIPETLAGVDPTSEAFLDYATGFGAENLLSVGYWWWHEPAAVRLRYEELVAAPRVRFAELIRTLGADTGRLDEALAARTLQYFQDLPNHHGWQGRPGLWRQLITRRRALRIAARHRTVFEKQGYEVRPLPFLTDRRAAANWRALG